MSSLFDRIRESLDGRRDRETSIRPRIYAGAAGRGRHLVRPGPGRQLMEVAGPPQTFRPGAIVPTGSWTDVDRAETILSMPAHPGAETPALAISRVFPDSGSCPVITGKTYTAIFVDGSPPYNSTRKVTAQLYNDGTYVSDLGIIDPGRLLGPSFAPWEGILQINVNRLAWTNTPSLIRNWVNFSTIEQYDPASGSPFGDPEWPSGPGSIPQPQRCHVFSGLTALECVSVDVSDAGKDAVTLGGLTEPTGFDWEDSSVGGVVIGTRFAVRGVNTSTSALALAFTTAAGGNWTVIDPASILVGKFVTDNLHTPVTCAELCAQLMKPDGELEYTVGLMNQAGLEIRHWPKAWGLTGLTVASSIVPSLDRTELVAYPVQGGLLRTVLRDGDGNPRALTCSSPPVVPVTAGPLGLPDAMIPRD